MNKKFVGLLLWSSVSVFLYGAEESLYINGNSNYGFQEIIAGFDEDNRNASAEIHSRDKKSKRYKCDFEGCSKSFSRSDHLKVHKLTHDPNRYKKYQCEFEDCGKAYSSKEILYTHSKIHLGKAYECDQCVYITPSLSNLNKHKLTHREDKPFKCDFEGCSFSCKDKVNLTSHKKTHLKERLLYKCEWPGCEKSFTSVGALKLHKLIHEGIKPHKCDFPDCEVAFRSQGDLKGHKRTHEGENLFACSQDDCRFRTRNSLNLKRHESYHNALNLLGEEYHEYENTEHQINPEFPEVGQYEYAYENTEQAGYGLDPEVIGHELDHETYAEGQETLGALDSFVGSDSGECSIYDSQYQMPLSELKQEDFELVEAEMKFTNLSESQNNRKRNFEEVWLGEEKDSLESEAKRMKFFEEE